MSDAWLESMENLPVLPAVVQRLLHVMEDELCSAEDITNVVSSDAALTSTILKLVNSPAFGGNQQVTEISRAVVMLGFSEIRNLAVSMGVKESIDKLAGNIDLESFWTHALATAAGTKLLAQQTGFSNPEEAFVAGLLHDIGELVLARYKPEEYTMVQLSGPKDRLEMERKAMGVTHPRAGRKLLKFWNLPSSLGEVVRKHHEEKAYASADDQLLSLVVLSDIISRIFEMSNEESVSERALTRLTKNLELDLTQMQDLLAKIFWAVSETRIFLDICTDSPWKLDQQDHEPRIFRTVIISSQPRRVLWISQILEYLKHEVIPMISFFSDIAEPDQADLVLIDTHSVSRGQLVKMKPLLAGYQKRIALYGDHGHKTVNSIFDTSFPVLEPVFNQADLEGLLE